VAQRTKTDAARFGKFQVWKTRRRREKCDFSGNHNLCTADRDRWKLINRRNLISIPSNKRRERRLRHDKFDSLSAPLQDFPFEFDRDVANINEDDEFLLICKVVTLLTIHQPVQTPFRA
jgi:hypothetical protein